MKNLKKISNKKSLFIAAIALLSANFSYAQLHITPAFNVYYNSDSYDNWTNSGNWVFSLDDDLGTPNDNNSFSWWQNGARNIGDLMMTLTRPASGVLGGFPELRIHGFLVTQNLENKSADYDNLTMYSNNTRSYIQSNGDDDGLFISSNTGNKIKIGDNNDDVLVNRLKSLGTVVVQDENDQSLTQDNLTMYADGTKSYIQSNGDEDGMHISSNTGNKIVIGDSNDDVLINRLGVKDDLIVKGIAAGTEDYIGMHVDGTRSYIESYGDEDGLGISSKKGNKVIIGDEDDDVFLNKVKSYGNVVVQNGEQASQDNLTMYADGTNSYIQSNGDEDGMHISSNTGNKITVGDDNDAVTIKNTTLTGNTIINNSNGVASISSNSGAAGSWIRFCDNTTQSSNTTGLLSAGANTMEFYTGTNLENREKILGIGSGVEGDTKFYQKNITFNYKTQNDLTQVSINSDDKVNDCALTIAGATHIGPKDANFRLFNYTDNIANYLLWVEKGIVTEDLAFASITDWKDKVFADDYKLTSLPDLETYLKTNRHLPGFHSEAEVIKNGYSAKEFNLSVLQQVEELVLYTIEQDKQIKQLKEQVDSYKKLENEVRLIKEKLNIKN